METVHFLHRTHLNLRHMFTLLNHIEPEPIPTFMPTKVIKQEDTAADIRNINNYDALSILDA